jgi:hypothetical protein
MTPDPLAVAALWLPALVLGLAADSALARGCETLGDRSHAELVTAQLDLRVLASVFRPVAPGAEIPPRRAIDGGGLGALRAFGLLDLAALALGLGLLWRLLGETRLIATPGALPGWAVALVAVLGVLELRRVLRTLRILASRRELRRTRRVPVAGLALVRRAARAGAADQPVTAKLLDLSPDGAGLVVPGPLEVGEIVTLTLLAGERPTRGATHVRAQVARAQEREDGLWTIGVRLTGNPPEVHRRIAELCATHAPMWRLRGAPERSRPRGTRRAA